MITEQQANNIRYTANILKDLHSVWVPHGGQIPIGRSLFVDGIKDNILECGRKFGKALALDTPILTTVGWSTMGKLSCGDYIYSPDGGPVMVIYKSNVMELDSYSIKFSTGETITACADHEWVINGEVLTTAELELGMSIPLTSPLQFVGNVPLANVMATLATNNIADGKYKIAPYIDLFLKCMGKSITLDGSTLVASDAPHIITAIKEVGVKSVQCISVDSEDKLYLCGSSLIATHNTDFLCYALWRWALTNPGTYNYYFAPLRDQIMDLVWANGRLPNFLPPNLMDKYVLSINNTDKRIVLRNGSFIKCDGSDNHEKARGYSATGLSAYDETKDFHKQFHVGYNPNRAITDAPLLAVGTPGDGNDLLSDLWDYADVSTRRGRAFRMPTSMNPHISAEFLLEERMKAVMKDELDVYLIEYEAQRIKLGSKFIFSMLTKDVIVDYAEAVEHVKKYRKDYDFYVSADPGSAKCFAVVFGAVHRFDKHIIILDEIYEPKLSENSVKNIAPRILDIVNAINPNYDDWQAAYDHAAAWFFSELMASFEDYPLNFVKCEKDTGTKENKLSLIKDGIISSTFKMTEKCIKLFWEMENYKTKDGKILKKDDHAIDALRYLYNLANYSSVEEAVPVILGQRYPEGISPEEDFNHGDGDDGYDDFDSWAGDY